MSLTGIPSDVLVAVRARLSNEVGAGPPGPWSAPCYTLGPPSTPPCAMGLFGSSGLSDVADALAQEELASCLDNLDRQTMLGLALAGADQPGARSAALNHADVDMSLNVEAVARSLALDSKLKRHRESQAAMSETGGQMTDSASRSWPIVVALPPRERTHHAS